MQVIVALVALPLVALILTLVTRLEDGLRAPSPVSALPAGPLAAVAAGDGAPGQFVEGLAEGA